MLFCSSNKVNKLVLLRRELHPVPSRLFKAAFVNLAKRSTVLLCALTVSKKVKTLNRSSLYIYKSI
jgi:hypothetical protein